MFYFATYGKAGEHGHPLATGIILNVFYLDGKIDGFEVLYSSIKTNVNEDIQFILDLAASRQEASAHRG